MGVVGLVGFITSTWIASLTNLEVTLELLILLCLKPKGNYPMINIALSTVPDGNEIKAAAFSLKSHSFPGQDGLSCSLFHAARDIVGDTIIRAIQHLFHSGKILRVTNIFFLYLIFKCNPPVTFGDFRPINMLFSTYKIISKILRSLNGSHNRDRLNTPQDIDKH